MNCVAFENDEALWPTSTRRCVLWGTLTSPAMAAAAAVTGRITDVRKLETLP